MERTVTVSSQAGAGLRFLTEHFVTLQGLRLIGVWLVSALTPVALIEHAHHSPDAYVVVVMSAAQWPYSQWIGRWYQRRYGRVFASRKHRDYSVVKAAALALAAEFFVLFVRTDGQTVLPLLCFAPQLVLAGGVCAWQAAIPAPPGHLLLSVRRLSYALATLWCAAVMPFGVRIVQQRPWHYAEFFVVLGGLSIADHILLGRMLGKGLSRRGQSSLMETERAH